jgi:glutathione synthase/RimK-type ligase-like ATP-grasp enzyme
MRRVALATCAEIPDGDEDSSDLIRELGRRDVLAEAIVWDDAHVDWDAYDLVVLRSTWDYPRRRDAFLDWADCVSDRLLNPVEVVRWNTDKHYFADLDSAGVAVVPTEIVDPEESFVLPDRPFVVKPVISAGAKDTVRYAAHDCERARAHVESLHRGGRSVMLQPYLEGIDVVGETALIFFDGELSHAIRKGPLLAEGAPPSAGLFAPEEIRPRQAGADEIELAERALAEAPGSSLLYARIDVVPHGGRPVVLEVELAEPSLFLAYSAGAVERFATAIARRLRT